MLTVFVNRLLYKVLIHTKLQLPVSVRLSDPFFRSSVQFGNMEGITTAVLDEFPYLRTNMKHKTIFLAVLCFCFYLMGLLLVTNVSPDQT